MKFPQQIRDVLSLPFLLCAAFSILIGGWILGKPNLYADIVDIYTRIKIKEKKH